jgi:plasmid stabilization system protein ParE
MRVINLLPEAGEELDGAASHYESQQFGLGSALLAEMTKTFDQIAELPFAARAVRGDLRRKFVRRFPYYILYRASDEEILIVAIARRRRRPGYWRRRL